MPLTSLLELSSLKLKAQLNTLWHSNQERCLLQNSTTQSMKRNFLPSSTLSRLGVSIWKDDHSKLLLTMPHLNTFTLKPSSRAARQDGLNSCKATTSPSNIALVAHAPCQMP